MEHAENTVRHGFVGVIVPSLWGGLGRGLTLLFFSGGHIGPHPTVALKIRVLMLNFSARLRKKTRESNGICGIQHYLCKVNLKIHIYI